MSLSVIRGGGAIGSRRRRPSRPVRLRVVRMPRVGPPAATCSSIVLGFDGFRCVVSPPLWPPPWPPRRRRWPLPVASTSGVASSRWVAAVSPARPSASSASTVVGFFPPRPRPPRRRRRFFGPVGELSPSAASGVFRSVASLSASPVSVSVGWLRPSAAAGAAAGAAVAAASARPRRRTSRLDPPSAPSVVVPAGRDPPPRPRPPRLRRRRGAPVPGSRVSPSPDDGFDSFVDVVSGFGAGTRAVRSGRSVGCAVAARSGTGSRAGAGAGAGSRTGAGAARGGFAAGASGSTFGFTWTLPQVEARLGESSVGAEGGAAGAAGVVS